MLIFILKQFFVFVHKSFNGTNVFPLRYKLNSYIHFEVILPVFVLKCFNGTNCFL
jgi:hypothetical protein